MNRKPSRLALAGMAAVCTALLIACSSGSPTVQSVSVTPTNGEIFVAPPGAAVRARASARTAPSANRARRAIKAQDATAAACGSIQYAATAFYSNGTSQDVSSTASWTSSNTSVANISTSGLATGGVTGTTNISAAILGVAATPVPLLVDQLNSIAVSPAATVNQPVGTTVQYSAMGTFTLASTGATQTVDISSLVTWSSTNTNVATIDPVAGLATIVGQGTTMIVATVCTNQTGTASLSTSAAAPQTLVITPATGSIAVGSAVQFTAQEMYTDGTLHPTTGTLGWKSDSQGTIANINASTGLALGVGVGTANITATETGGNALTNTVPLAVTAAAAHFAYVASLAGNGGSGSVSGYTVTLGSGGTSSTLTPLAGSPFSGHSPQQFLLHPSGDFAYAPDSGSALHIYTVNSTTGAIAEQDATITPVTAGSGGANVGVIEPLGRFIYVLDDGSSSGTPSIYGFSINTNPNAGTVGTLTGITGLTPFTTGLTTPVWAVTDITGSYLYVVDTGTNHVLEYSINQSTGALTSIGSIATDSSPFFAATDINGHLYVANSGTSTISAYAIAPATGVLSQIGSSTAISGTTGGTINVLADPSGKYLYVLDIGTSSGNGQVYSFNLNADGSLGSQIGSAVATGNSPTGMAIDPTGVFLAIDDNGSGNSTPAVSLYNVTTGTVAAATPASVAADTAAQFITFYTANPGQ